MPGIYTSIKEAQMIRKVIIILSVVLAVAAVLAFGTALLAQDNIEKYIPDPKTAEEGMTLWQIISSGGEVMIVLAFLSIVALGLILYYFLTINEARLLPADLQEEVISSLEQGDHERARLLCENDETPLSNIISAGLSRRGRDKIVLKEAIEDEGRRNVEALWQRLSYLGDIAAISPMVGLLGTVLGMIQAFNVIAFQTGAVKPILLASGISKAMVTTATGLIIAIPAMIFYAFFRGRVRSASARLEIISMEILHLLSDHKG
ncbi:MAG: MotA/TolQ/ExbB proton channel family protein [Candidatus Omnitrophica bacterium]|nr:MotA/TolQ/ExbB proton channel family protein [Candidatus Omnitrophota bacterium]